MRAWLGRVGVVVVIIALAGAAWPAAAQEANPVVSTVNGQAILRAEFHARVRLVRWQYLGELEKLYELTNGALALVWNHVKQRVTELQDPGTLAAAVLTQLEDERLLWQAGEARGLTPTAEDAQAQEDMFFSLWTGVPVDQLAADADAQAFIARWYAEAEAVSGLDQDSLRALFATEALRHKLFDALSAQLPTEELAVRSRHILCSFHPDNLSDLTPPDEARRAAAQACITEAQARLSAGETFAAVAEALSDDPNSAGAGGEVGWVLLSYLLQPYADAVTDAELNTLIGPVETEFGLHLIEVLERRMQPLSEDELAESRQGYFDLWLETLRAGADIRRGDGWSDGVPDTPGLESLDPVVLAALTASQSEQAPVGWEAVATQAAGGAR